MKERQEHMHDILPCGCIKAVCRCNDCHQGLDKKGATSHIRCCAEHKD